MSRESGKYENITGSVIVNGAVGGNVINNVTNSFNKTKAQNAPDLLQLADELARLREVMRQNVKSHEHDDSVNAIVKAEKAAKANDYRGVLAHLKVAGYLALKIAEEFGASIAAETIKRAAGL